MSYKSFIRELRSKLKQDRYEWLRNLGYSMHSAAEVNRILQFTDSFTSIKMLKNFNHYAVFSNEVVERT